MQAIRLLSAGPLVALALLLAAFPGSARSDPQAACRTPKAEPASIAAFLKTGCYRDWPRDKSLRQTGPRPGERAPHGKVRVYYSPEVNEWLKAGRPDTGIPDGGMIYKEMYDWATERLFGGAYMLKRRGVSFDGWLWGGFGQKSGGAWGAYGNPGCLNCHASADNRELTFAYLPYLAGEVTASEPGEEGRAPRRGNHTTAPPRRARRAIELPVEPDARSRPSAAFLARYPISFSVGRAPGLALPDEGLADDYVSGPRGPDVFLPSSNCALCHRADPPSVMTVRAEEPRGLFLDVSPAGEWGGSLMALSGRDPVFLAQLEHEKALRPKAAAYLDDTCFGCHGVMGQRQLALDRAEPFTQEMLYARGDHPAAKYGALARDGVSCALCHHIAEAGLGSEASLGGAFRIGPKDEVYGPYMDDVKERPMQQALGITPRGGGHVRRSALCGSCHTVLLPRTAAGSAAPRKDAERHHEQTTYLEWRNSAYEDERSPGPEAKTCQACHMPTAMVPARGDRPAAPLSSKVADIEEYLPNVKNSLRRKDLTLPRRSPIARHTLVGLNYFVLSMFDQFDKLLGAPQPDPPAPDDPEPVMPGPVLTRRETLKLATQSATVEFVQAPRRLPEHIEARVRVRNLAGHKLPSGVGFRRAFLAVKLLDEAGAVLWASGETDQLGLIIGADGKPLSSELSTAARDLQPHHERITGSEQVQIYEERHTDEAGRLTVSFLGLFGRAKDNRLLPRGWRTTAQAPKTAFMQPAPAAVALDPAYRDGSGSDEVLYEIKLDDKTRRATSISAALYYQALPPYYLKALFDGASGKETQRLYYIASRLSTAAPSPIVGWKLHLAESTAKLR